jgi:hypothetical protein
MPIDQDARADLEILTGAPLSDQDWNSVRQCLRCLVRGQKIVRVPADEADKVRALLEEKMPGDELAPLREQALAGYLRENPPGRAVITPRTAGLTAAGAAPAMSERAALRKVAGVAREQGVGLVEAARQLVTGEPAAPVRPGPPGPGE